MDSCQDQVIAIADFASRNGIEVGSADHEFHRFFADESKRQAMLDAIGPDLFSTTAHWAFLRLPRDGRALYFPSAPAKSRVRPRSLWNAARVLHRVLNLSVL